MIPIHSGLICATSMRPQNMSFSWGNTQDSLANRKKFLAQLGIDYRSLVCANQEHSDNVRYVLEADRGRGASSLENALGDTDALITDKRNVALAVFTADCLPIFLYDPKKPGIGLVHAGWRGSKKGIILRTISAMKEHFNTNPGDLYAEFGPGIKSCCYEVGEEFGELFPQDLLERQGRYYLDLVSFNKKQLLSSGVREQNVSGCSDCTFCSNEKYFSFRKEKEAAGRMISVILLK